MFLRGNQSTTSLETNREWKNGESAENIHSYKGKFTKLLFASVLLKSLFLRVIRL